MLFKPVTSDRISIALSSRTRVDVFIAAKSTRLLLPFDGCRLTESEPWQHNCCPCTDAAPHAWATTRGNRNYPRVAELPGIQKVRRRARLK
ncbi:hypothetical protein K443DRAFT_632560 [Laccaria amethystina LaAM-08-1]|uniref:Unplaced genomic scaffold K443scaffold_166, whole genome shotgun sequence n=1 Tax=Laccaria amethystina LaAM-08-1 TaxID=1095629 RepID=A0A0C9XLT3_9AGAR|nr:hypothetical protein K443DRAFT_632560 [Laccaria amethystina LaAM-08-1]